LPTGFLVKDVLAKGSCRHIGHQRSYRVLLLETDTGFGERPAHPLNFAKPDADARPPELDGESDLADLHASTDIVRFYFLRAAALYAGRFMRDARVGEGAPHHPRPR